MLILVVEFCSIFCNVIIIQIKNTYKEKLPQNQKIIGLVKLFLIFLIIVAIVILLGFFGAKNYYIPIIFALSVINKLSNHLTGRQVMIKKEIATPALTLLFTIVFAAATSTFWVKLFPFSEEVLKMKPENLVITGALQDLLVWGVLYYLMLEIINILSFRKQINS
ncbi:MAG: hypothetical protein NTX00_02560 [Candidatus Parcubacteria bacterium]|nr:hypothetical protein [Candidatus Parcubacteria bacterium]